MHTSIQQPAVTASAPNEAIPQEGRRDIHDAIAERFNRALQEHSTVTFLCFEVCLPPGCNTARAPGLFKQLLTFVTADLRDEGLDPSYVATWHNDASPVMRCVLLLAGDLGARSSDLFNLVESELACALNIDSASDLVRSPVSVYIPNPATIRSRPGRFDLMTRACLQGAGCVARCSEPGDTVHMVGCSLLF